MESLAGLSLKQLKALVAEAGLSSADCLDKDDLLARAAQAQQLLAAQPSAAQPAGGTAGPARTSHRSFGGYECVVNAPAEVLDGAAADLVVVMLHGLGATNMDLVPLCTLLSEQEAALASKKVVWIFPQAPAQPIGNAWWMLDVPSFMAAMMSPNNEAMLARLIREEPAGLSECRTRMASLIKEARQFAGGIPSNRVLMSGFSLGAITSLDIALQQPSTESLAGVVMMNGAPIVVDQWAERLKSHPKLRVHMSAGLQDAVLPSKATDWAHQLLQSNGAVVKLMKHPGGHEVGGPDVIRSIANFMAESLPS